LSPNQAVILSEAKDLMLPESSHADQSPAHPRKVAADPSSTAQKKYVSVGQEVPLNHEASDCSRRNHQWVAIGVAIDSTQI
jgi:hypothetical protein